MSIAIERLKRAIADLPKSGMQTGDYKVNLKLADAQRAIAELEGLKAERDAFLTELQKANATIIDLQRNPPKFTQQHLAEIRADAVKEFAESIGVFSREYDDQGYVEVAEWRIKEYVDELRQGVK
jgi:hypothetical protein